MRRWCIFLAPFFLTAVAHAKRLLPVTVPPIVHGDRQCDSARDSETGGYMISIMCRRLSTGDVIWKTKLFDVHYDPLKETDVQDIFLASLTLSREVLTATDERGRVFTLDAKTGGPVAPQAITPPTARASAQVAGQTVQLSAVEARALIVATKEAERLKLNVARYRVSIAKGIKNPNALFVTFTDASAPPNASRGNSGSLPALEVKVDANSLALLSSAFVR